MFKFIKRQKAIAQADQALAQGINKINVRNLYNELSDHHKASTIELLLNAIIDNQETIYTTDGKKIQRTNTGYKITDL